MATKKRAGKRMGTVADLVAARKRAHRRETWAARALLAAVLILALWLA